MLTYVLAGGAQIGNSVYYGAVICYLPTLLLLARERAPCRKISGGSRKYRKGVDHRKGGFR